MLQLKLSDKIYPNFMCFCLNARVRAGISIINSSQVECLDAQVAFGALFFLWFSPRVYAGI